MKAVGARRPSRVVGIDHDSHPGLIGLPGSQSILAALPGPLDTRSPARETLPQPRLPGHPIEPPSRCNHAGVLPRVGDWETSRCSTRGLFMHGTGFASRISRFLNFSTARREFGDQTGGDGREPFHSVTAFHGLEHGASDAREVVKGSRG